MSADVVGNLTPLIYTVQIGETLPLFWGNAGLAELLPESMRMIVSMWPLRIILDYAHIADH